MFERPRLPFRLNSPYEPADSVDPTGSLVAPGTSSNSLVKSRPFTGNSATSEASIVPPVVLEVVSTSGTSALTWTISCTMPVASLASARVGEPTLTGNIRQRRRSEALLLDGDAVGAQRQLRGYIPARSFVGTVRDNPVPGLKTFTCAPATAAPERVRDRALNASPESLSKGTACKYGGKKNK